MTDDHRTRRVADASALLKAIAPYTKVESDARIAAVHNELMFAIDRALAKHDGHRFQNHEIDVLKDVAFQIVYVLDAMTQSPKGFRHSLWQEFKRASAMKKVGVLATTLAFIGGAMLGSITLYKETIKPWFTTPAPAVTASPPTPTLTPPPGKK
jgi:hypothetical protein